MERSHVNHKCGSYKARMQLSNQLRLANNVSATSKDNSLRVSNTPRYPQHLSCSLAADESSVPHQATLPQDSVLH